MKKLLFKLIKFFVLIVSPKPAISVDLLDEYEGYLSGNDISVQDTLLGTVKSVMQYDINLKYNFYHIPEKYITSPDGVKYVALYRSKNIFGNDKPGVLHYGEVISFERIKRSEIRHLDFSTNNNEMYYVFNVSSWHELRYPVAVRDSGPYVLLMSNSYLLENSKYTYELFLSDNNKFKLSLALVDIVSGVYDEFFVGDSRVRHRKSKITVFTPNNKYSFKVSYYRRHPLDTVEKIYLILFGT